MLSATPRRRDRDKRFASNRGRRRGRRRWPGGPTDGRTDGRPVNVPIVLSFATRRERQALTFLALLCSVRRCHASSSSPLRPVIALWARMRIFCTGRAHEDALHYKCARDIHLHRSCAPEMFAFGSRPIRYGNQCTWSPHADRSWPSAVFDHAVLVRQSRDSMLSKVWLHSNCLHSNRDGKDYLQILCWRKKFSQKYLPVNSSILRMVLVEEF